MGRGHAGAVLEVLHSDRHAGQRAGILPGRHPGVHRLGRAADIPVEQPLKFDLVFNNTTAKALGLTIPELFLVRVTEMIE